MMPMEKLADRPVCDFSKEEYFQHGRYWTDGTKIFRDLHNLPLPKADPSAFEYFLGLFGRDAKSCYINRERVRGGDPESFAVLNHCFAADAKLLYAAGDGAAGCTRKITSPGELRVLGSGKWYYGIFPKERSVSWNPGGHVIDGGQVLYFLAGFPISPIKNADAETFEAFSDAVYSRDRERVYVHHKWLRQADRASWHKCIDFPHCLYSRDDRNIYWNGEVV